MYIILKAAITVDGFLGAKQRLIISGPEDAKAVNELRARVDAILIGAGTLRADNPSLLVRNSQKQPLRIVLSRNAEFDSNLNLFADKKAKTIVCHSNPKFIDKADFHFLEKTDLRLVIEHLTKLGIKRLLVEGGASILNQFYSQAVFDQLRLSVGNQIYGKEGLRLILAGKQNLKLVKTELLGKNLVHEYKKA